MPWARVNGQASTSQAAVAGSRPTRRAIAGTLTASATSPAAARTRNPRSPNQGFVETCATSPPQTSGSGPYGDGVFTQVAPTACTIGPVRSSGV